MRPIIMRPRLIMRTRLDTDTWIRDPYGATRDRDGYFPNCCIFNRLPTTITREEVEEEEFRTYQQNM